MVLQKTGGYHIRNRTFNCFGQYFSFSLTPGHQENFFGGHNGSHTHSDGKMRNMLFAVK